MKITKRQLRRIIRESTYEDWRDDINIADDWYGDLSNTQDEYSKLRSPAGNRIGISWYLGVPMWSSYAKSTFMKRYGNRAGATVRIVRDRKDPPLVGYITVNGIKSLDLSDLSNVDKRPRELADLLKKTMDESLKDPERMAQYKDYLNSNRGPGMVMASARSSCSKMRITEAQLRRIVKESLKTEIFGFGKKKKKESKIEKPVYLIRVDSFPKSWAAHSYRISKDQDNENRKSEKQLGKEIGAEVDMALLNNRYILAVQKPYETSAEAKSVVSKINTVVKKMLEDESIHFGKDKQTPEAIKSGKIASILVWDSEKSLPWEKLL